MSRRLSLALGLAAVLAGGGALVLDLAKQDEVHCRPAPARCAPDPGGDEQAGVPLPPPDRLFGFNESPEVQGFDPASLERLAVLAGANARRFPVDWRAVEPSQGQWDEGGWADYQRTYDAIVAAGMKPIVDFGFAPAWAREPGYAAACADFVYCRFPPARSYDDAWARFAAEVAKRFPRAVLEVWNEPNLTIFWRSGPDPQRFAELLAIAYRAIREVNPGASVIAGGLAGNPDAAEGSGDLPIGVFLDRAYASTPSIAGHMDGIAFHPYPYGLELGAGSFFADTVAEVREVSASNGDGGRGLWVTETGIASSGPRSVSEDQQADLSLRLYRRLATMDDVKAIVFHRLLTPPTAAPGSSESGFALLRGGQTPPIPEPAYCAFVTLAGNSYPGC